MTKCHGPIYKYSRDIFRHDPQYTYSTTLLFKQIRFHLILFYSFIKESLFASSVCDVCQYINVDLNPARVHDRNRILPPPRLIPFTCCCCCCCFLRPHPSDPAPYQCQPCCIPPAQPVCSSPSPSSIGLSALSVQWLQREIFHSPVTISVHTRRRSLALHSPGNKRSSVKCCLLNGSVLLFNKCLVMIDLSMKVPDGNSTGSDIRVSINGSRNSSGASAYSSSLCLFATEKRWKKIK